MTKSTTIPVTFDDQFFSSYQRYGGKHTRELFQANLPSFYRIVGPVFHGNFTKDVEDAAYTKAFVDWYSYMRNDIEADCYIYAVDSIFSPMSRS